MKVTFLLSILTFLTTRCEGYKKGFSSVLNGPRGGADRKMVAATAVALLDGLYGVPLAFQAEKMGKDLYKFEDSIPHGAIWANAMSGTTIYTNAIAMMCALRQTSVNTAIAATMAPFLLQSLHNQFSNQPAKAGYSSLVEVFNLATLSAAIAATTKRVEYANTAILVAGAWFLIQAFLWFWNPSILATQRHSNGDVLFLAFRNYGNNLFRSGIFLASVGAGTDLMTAMGYSWVTCGIGLILEFSITKNISEISPTAHTVLYVWVSLLMAVGAALAL